MHLKVLASDWPRFSASYIVTEGRSGPRAWLIAARLSISRLPDHKDNYGQHEQTGTHFDGLRRSQRRGAYFDGPGGIQPRQRGHCYSRWRASARLLILPWGIQNALQRQPRGHAVGFETTQGRWVGGVEAN